VGNFCICMERSFWIQDLDVYHVELYWKYFSSIHVFRIFWTTVNVQMPNVCRGAKSCPNRPNGIGHIAIFRFSTWWLSAILDFRNFKFLVAGWVGRANMHHYTKFHQNRSNNCGDIAFNVFFKWLPSAISDLYDIFWDHPRRVHVFGDFYDCA